MRMPGWRGDPRSWLWASVVAAGLAMVGNVVGLVAPERIYGQESLSLLHQGIAQDVVNLLLVAPLVVASVVLARRGSLRSYVAWLGLLVFTVYTYVIYTFAVGFSALFLLWVAVLGLTSFALVGGLTALDPAGVRAGDQSPPWRTAGWFLIAAAVLFGGVWLADVIPALVSGSVPDSVAELGLPTNPVHVLDLALLLPVSMMVGVGLLRRSGPAFAVAPALVAFLGLTGVPILVTPFVALARGETADWSVSGPIGVVTAVSLAVFVALLRTVRRRSARPTLADASRVLARHG
jgi:hypothetical protein